MLLMDKMYEGNKTVTKETPALLLSCRRSTTAKNCKIMTTNCIRSATALSDFPAACAPVTTNSILCSAHSFIWLVSIWLYTARTFPAIGKSEKVAVSAFGDAFDTANEAAEWNAQFQVLLEKENWYYQDIRYDNTVYKQGDVYAVIIKPQQRDDGLTATMIMFSKTLSAFSRLQ
jgi:hypothetical protein